MRLVVFRFFFSVGNFFVSGFLRGILMYKVGGGRVGVELEVLSVVFWFFCSGF